MQASTQAQDWAKRRQEQIEKSKQQKDIRNNIIQQAEEIARNESAKIKERQQQNPSSFSYRSPSQEELIQCQQQLRLLKQKLSRQGSRDQNQAYQQTDNYTQQEYKQEQPYDPSQYQPSQDYYEPQNQIRNKSAQEPNRLTQQKNKNNAAKEKIPYSNVQKNENQMESEQQTQGNYRKVFKPTLERSTTQQNNNRQPQKSGSNGKQNQNQVTNLPPKPNSRPNLGINQVQKQEDNYYEVDPNEYQSVSNKKNANDVKQQPKTGYTSKYANKQLENEDLNYQQKNYTKKDVNNQTNKQTVKKTPLKGAKAQENQKTVVNLYDNEEPQEEKDNQFYQNNKYYNPIEDQKIVQKPKNNFELQLQAQLKAEKSQGYQPSSQKSYQASTKFSSNYESSQNLNQELEECPDCQRKFNPESISKHIKICKKVFQQKRKQFNSAESRIPEGVNHRELQQIQKGMNTKTEAPQKRVNPQQYKNQSKQIDNQQIKAKNNKVSWKSQSEQFRLAMKAARLDQEGNPKEAEKLQAQMMKEQLSNYIRCDYCGRSFNHQAAERHIPFCKDKSKMNAIKTGGRQNTSKKR